MISLLLCEKRFGPTETPKTDENPPTNIKPTALPSFNIETIASTGLNIISFTTPSGEIRVKLTNDLAAGDNISGTVEEQPKGKTESERARNQSALNGYVVGFEQQKKPVTERTISCQIPAKLTTEATLISSQ